MQCNISFIFSLNGIFEMSQIKILGACLNCFIGKFCEVPTINVVSKSKKNNVYACIPPFSLY